MLISSPCFLQNSSNDLSVTNVSTTRSWPAEIQALYLGHGYAKQVRCPFPRVSFLSLCEGRRDSFDERMGSRDARFLSQNSCQGACDMRGSRTLSMPFPIRYLSRAGLHTQHLPQRPQRPPVSDSGTHPECSEPEANRACRTAQALSNLFHWFVPSQIQQPVVIRRCPWPGGWPPGCGSFARSSLPWLGGAPQEAQVRGLPQMSDALPAVSARPVRCQLKDLVDRLLLLGRAVFDPRDQQLIDVR